jgi:hypothetical protein
MLIVLQNATFLRELFRQGYRPQAQIVINLNSFDHEYIFRVIRCNALPLCFQLAFVSH